ncbi:hypothetical protein BDA96_10G018700 [Sorghum bicolor]|uniref:Uncharacterized protein n=1 Tax=Sorghum bicolor TaxID=4558 RepID=A0A921PWT2_SORBI|nr:hypothetical protein BDA96_10G018700 [Sorghum bicolor]
MADVLVDSQRRVLISGYGYGLPPPQPAESLLLGRLDQIDLRLRQLEEQQQQRRPSHDDHGAPAPAPAPTRRAPAAQHQHTKSMPAALQHVQVRGDLMDRLNLLESRIRQVSCELGLDSGGGKAVHPQFGLGLGLGSSSSVPAVEDPATWSDSAPVAVVDPAFGGGKVQNKPAAAGGSWSAVEILQRGARQLHRSTSKTNPPIKVNKLKEAKSACEKEKRRAERSKSLTKAERSKSLTSRLWLMVGCKH